MDSNPPTVGDFAWQAARFAQADAARNAAENNTLRERIEVLEQDVQLLAQALITLLAPADQARDSLLTVRRSLPTEAQEAMRTRVREQRRF